MIDEFKGPYAFLSNMYPAHVEIEHMMFASVEHGYVAMKTEDVKIRKRIALGGDLATISGYEIKRFGYTLKLREDWNQIKTPIIEQLIRSKFQDVGLMAALIKTHPHELIEGNYWGDDWYGKCGGRFGCRKHGAHEFRGKNHLGRILMKIRSEGMTPWLFEASDGRRDTDSTDSSGTSKS